MDIDVENQKYWLLAPELVRQNGMSFMKKGLLQLMG